MKIKEIRAYKKDLALTKPYTVAYQTYTSAINAFIEVELENGIVGLGAAAEGEFVIGESMDETIGNLQSDFFERWIGRDIRHFNALITESNSFFVNHSATRAAIDIALHDAFCKYLEIPVVDFYGRKHTSLPTSVTIGICNLEETLSEAETYKKNGFRILKLKLGHNVDLDIERCHKLRERYGDYFTIRVDANQGYNIKETMKFYQSTEKLDLELIEQPMAVGHEQEMNELPYEIRQIMACDESLKNAEAAFKLASEPRTCGIFNIKLMKCGGISGALDIANIAFAAGIDLFWGCFDESIISISAALHTAFSCTETKYLDLDGSLDLAEDIVTGGFQIKDGVMSIVDGPGFGFKKL
jgi:L-alanine-DL-glutamate epimerase-like enolase superfamily enzyme